MKDLAIADRKEDQEETEELLVPSLDKESVSQDEDLIEKVDFTIDHPVKKAETIVQRD